MKAKYLGVISPEDDGPRRVGFAGKSFPRGHFVDVTDVPEKLKAKLVLHPNFETSEDPMTDDELAALDTVNGVEEPAAAGAQAAAPGDKSAVIAALEALQAKHPELKFNPKSPVTKLQEALEAAQFQYGDDD